MITVEQQRRVQLAAASCFTTQMYHTTKHLKKIANNPCTQDGMIDYAEFSWLLRSHNQELKGSGRANAKGALSRIV